MPKRTRHDRRKAVFVYETYEEDQDQFATEDDAALIAFLTRRQVAGGGYRLLAVEC